MFYETTGCKITNSLESNWLVIKEELTRLQKKTLFLGQKSFFITTAGMFLVCMLLGRN